MFDMRTGRACVVRLQPAQTREERRGTMHLSQGTYLHFQKCSFYKGTSITTFLKTALFKFSEPLKCTLFFTLNIQHIVYYP